LVRGGVVQQGGDGGVLVGAGLQGQGGDRQQVADVRGAALARLVGVQPGGEGQGGLEARSQGHATSAGSAGAGVAGGPGSFYEAREGAWPALESRRRQTRS